MSTMHRERRSNHPRHEPNEAEEWAPQRLSLPRGNSRNEDGPRCRRQSLTQQKSGREDNGGAKKKKTPEMFESFRNLEDAMAMAMAESMKTAQKDADDRTDMPKRGASLAESFRNLDLALDQARQNSLKDSDPRSHSSKPTKSDCIRRLTADFGEMDEEMALAIKNSLSEKGKGLFESFRNLDGVLGQVMETSLGDDRKPAARQTGRELCESFSNLDAAMAQAMQNSLGEGAEQGQDSDDMGFGGGGFGHLDRLEENDGDWSTSERGSEIGSSMHSGAGSISGMGVAVGGGSRRSSDTLSVGSFRKEKQRRRSSKLDSESEEEFAREFAPAGRVEHIDEPAPNLSRLARRHANRRFSNNRLNASLNYSDLEQQNDAASEGKTNEEELVVSVDTGLDNERKTRSGTRGPNTSRLTREKGARVAQRHSSFSAGGKSSSRRRSSSSSNFADESNNGGQISQDPPPNHHGSFSRRRHRSRNSSSFNSVDEQKEETEDDRANSLQSATNRMDALASNDLAIPTKRKKKSSKLKMFGR